MPEDGLVDGAADIFQGLKKAEDYHSEMNSAHYENWIRFVQNNITQFQFKSNKPANKFTV